MRRSLAAIVAAVTFTTLGAGSALADGPVASTDGSSAQYITSNNSFINCDTDADGDWIYVSWRIQGSSDITTYENHNGSGSCTYPLTGLANNRTIEYKSCQDDNFADTCSAWKTTTS